jgi:hypothetical protein
MTPLILTHLWMERRRIFVLTLLVLGTAVPACRSIYMYIYVYIYIYNIV